MGSMEVSNMEVYQQVAISGVAVPYTNNHSGTKQIFMPRLTPHWIRICCRTGRSCSDWWLRTTL